MAEKQFDFSIIMEDEEKSSSIPKDVWGGIPIKEDKKGPKTIAVVLFLGAILVLFQSYQDFLLHSSEDISDEEVETLLETPNSQSDVQITEEQYQQFHDDARDSNGFIIRAIGLGIAGTLILVGSINTFRLKQTGPIISTTGATIGLISGVYGSQLIRLASDENLSGALLLTYEIFVYLCGVCMFVCGAFAALPMINARARKAMKGNFWDNVELIDPNEVKFDAGKSDLEEDSGDDSELDSNSSDDSNLKQSKESSSKKTEDKAPNITYNIQNISIHDSVVIDSDLSSGEE